MHPQTPMPRVVVLEQRQKPDNLDLIAERDGVPVGVATVSKFGGAPDGELAYLTMRVVARGAAAGCRHRAASAAPPSTRAVLGKTRVRSWSCATTIDDSLAFYGARGFDERRTHAGRAASSSRTPRSRRRCAGRDRDRRRLTEATDRGAYAVALEADADIPSGEPIVTGPFEQWHDAPLRRPLTLRDLSFVALDGRAGRRLRDPAAAQRRHGEHWMTGVARCHRGRGIALALKEAQIAAAKAAGWAFLRTQNDLGNAADARA